MSTPGAVTAGVIEGGQPDAHAEPVRGGLQGRRPPRVADGHRGLRDAEPAHRGQRGARRRARPQDEGGGVRAAGQRRDGSRTVIPRGRQALGQRGDHARDVGVVPVALAGVEDHRVGRADLGHQRPGLVEQGQHRALERHGQGQPGPVRPAPPDQPGQASLVTLDGLIGPAVQAQRLIPGTVQDRRQRVSDRRAENGGFHDRSVQPEPVCEPVPVPELPYICTALSNAAAVEKNKVFPDLLMVRKYSRLP